MPYSVFYLTPYLNLTTIFVTANYEFIEAKVFVNSSQTKVFYFPLFLLIAIILAENNNKKMNELKTNEKQHKCVCL